MKSYRKIETKEIAAESNIMLWVYDNNSYATTVLIVIGY